MRVTLCRYLRIEDAGEQLPLTSGRPRPVASHIWQSLREMVLSMIGTCGDTHGEERQIFELAI